jgi:hypothetical protein
METKPKWVLKHNKDNSYYKLVLNETGEYLRKTSTTELKEATTFDNYLQACNYAKFNPAFTMVSYKNEL